ncbi:MAG: pirin family protein [Candidatus Methylomirabilales bacterium]
MLRPVIKVVTGQETSDGAGVRLKRVIGTRELDHLDPFLLLDEFKSDKPGDYLAGFPDHPHRGFETVTYMLAGLMRHQDHKGNRGDLTAGSVQWMTAGRGIIHSEMPQQQDGLMWGFQLWVNLPAKDKMCQPRYQDIPPERIPEVRLTEQVRVRVIAGELGGIRGPVEGIITQPLYVDVAMAPRSRFEHPVPAEHNAFAYLFEGEGEFGASEGHAGQVISSGSLAVFGQGDTVAAVTTAAPMRFLLLAGRPLREPITRYGPFVMNTREEIMQAIQDYQSGTFLV